MNAFSPTLKPHTGPKHRTGLTLMVLTVAVFATASVLAQPRERRITAAEPTPAAETTPADAAGATREGTRADDAAGTEAAQVTQGNEATPRVARPVPEPGARGGAGKSIHYMVMDTDGQMDMIDRSWHFRLHRALTAAERAKADGFLLEINTNGGALDAAFMIQDRLLKTTIPVYVFINSKAISAGALISLAANEIIMGPTAKIGDALPVTPDPNEASGMKAADAKVISVVAAQARAAAQARGHNSDLAVAMVDPTRPYAPFSQKGELLTLTALEAVQAGLTDMVAQNTDEVLRLLDLEGAELVTTQLTPLEQLAGLLSRHVVVSALASLAFLGLLIELKSPGIGLPGAFALLCLGLLFFGTSLADLSGFIEPLLLLIGVLLLVLEIFVIPGFGVAGIGGIVCVMLSIGLSVTYLPASPLELTDLWLAPMVYTMLGTMVGTVVMVPIMFKLLPYIPYLKDAFLDPHADPELASSANDPQELAFVALVGSTGEAATDLRPAGVAVIAGERYDVVTDGRYVERGTAITVREVTGNRIVVAPRE